MRSGCCKWGTPTEFELPLERAGVVAVALEVAAIPDELTHRQQPGRHPCERCPRSAPRDAGLRANPAWVCGTGREPCCRRTPAVDLVHFTILRPPTKQDATPVQELSLIPFPARELFDANLDDFHLVIFDRYHLRGILPPQYLSNIAEYVVRGGALLDIAGPSYAGRFSLVNTPLREILPTLPGRGSHRAPLCAGALGGRAKPPRDSGPHRRRRPTGAPGTGWCGACR